MDKLGDSISKFSGSILLAEGKQVIINNSYGFADREKGIKNESNTKFLIGSISKIFTAVAIMKLYEEEMLDISESVNKYLDVEKLEDDIKIIHLLNHTSGLKNFVLCRKEFNLYEDNKPSEIVEKVCGMSRSFTVGKRLSYNNTGYVILALIIEKVSKVKFEDYISNNIFLQLGMNDSSFISKDNKDIARGYKKGRVTNLFHHSAFFGCGDIISTTGDLSKFLWGINEGKIINKDLVREMQKIHSKNIMLKYGYGFMITEKLGEEEIGHSGSIPKSYASKLSYYPKSDLIIIVLCNDIRSVKRFIPGVMTAQYIGGYLHKKIGCKNR